MWRPLLLAAATVAALSTQAASAETGAAAWPTRQVHIVVPTPPGGSIDLSARVIAAGLQEIWGQPVIVDNKPGAAMRIGADYVAKAAPDGYTLLAAHDGALSMAAVVYKRLSYDPRKDFAPLGLIATAPEVLLENEKTPARSVRELVDYAKAHPGKLTHATGGLNALLYLELFKTIAKVDIVSVPYNGGAPSTNAVIGGATDLFFADLGTASPALQSPTVRPLAVTTRERSPDLPTLPTMIEAGVPGYEGRAWIGLFAPAGAPKDIQAKIEADLATVMRKEEVRGRIRSIHMNMGQGTAAEMRDVLFGDIEKWGRVVAEQHLELDEN